MEKITRRALLCAIPSAGASVALPAMATDTAKAAEHPWDRAHKLAAQLADVLNEGDGWDGPSGKCYAEIYPNAVAFGDIASRRWKDSNVSLQLRTLIAEHKAAREAFHNAIDECNRGNPSKAAERRWRRTSDAEEAALAAICAHRPIGDTDARAKARYLMPFLRKGEMQEIHVAALINSAVRPTGTRRTRTDFR